jgi:nitrate/nitrite transporter NarK
VKTVRPWNNRWCILAVLNALYVVAYFYRTSGAVMALDLARDLSLSPRQLGNMAAVLFYGFAFAQLPLGPLLDRFGARRTIFLLGLVTAIGAGLFARASGYGGVLVGRALIGIGTSCVLMGSLKIYTRWFSPHRFAALSGVQVALGNIGNLLATAPLGWLLGSIGWRVTFAGFGVLSAVAALLVLVVVRDAPRDEPPPARQPLADGWRRLAGRADFWRLAGLAFFWYGSYMAIQGLWGGPYLRRVLGLDRAGAARLLLMIALGYIVGCPLAGRLSDRVLRSRKKLLLIGQAGLLACLGMFLGPLESLPAVCRPALFFLFGLCGSSGPVLFAQIKELFPRRMAATAMTAVNFFVMLGAALTQQGMGRVLAAARQAGGSPASAFRLAFAVPFVGLLLAWLVYSRCRDSHPESNVLH